MPKTSHIILGVTPSTPYKIERLKKKGQKEIFVMDYEQSSKVNEKNGIFYLSPESASMFIENDPTIVCHFFMYIPPGSRKKRHK